MTIPTPEEDLPQKEMTPVWLRLGDGETVRLGDITGDTPVEYFKALADLLRAAADQYEQSATPATPNGQEREA